MNALQRYEPDKRDGDIRPEMLREIEVDCSVVNTSLPGTGQQVTEGTCRLEVFESDLPGIYAMVADADLSFEPSEGRAVELGDEAVTDMTRINLAKERDREARENHLALNQNGEGTRTWRDVSTDFTGPVSWVHHYCDDNFPRAVGLYKSVLPLRRVRVVSEAKQPPMSHEAKAANVQVMAIVNALNGGGGSSAASDIVKALLEAGVIPAPNAQAAPAPTPATEATPDQNRNGNKRRR